MREQGMNTRLGLGLDADELRLVVLLGNGVERLDCHLPEDVPITGDRAEKQQEVGDIGQ
jgi:hypothetical protein